MGGIEYRATAGENRDAGTSGRADRLAKAEALRQRGAALIASALEDPLAEHFPLGTGGAKGGRAGASDAALSRLVRGREMVDRAAHQAALAQSDRIIYRDDADVIERLEQRIEFRLAERAALKQQHPGQAWRWESVTAGLARDRRRLRQLRQDAENRRSQHHLSVRDS